MRQLAMYAALVGALALTGCLGGGQEDMPVTEMPEEDREQVEALAGEYRTHPTFARQWGLARIGADQAYARLAIEHGEEVRPGAGVTVGVFDTGIDQDHPAFAETRIDEVFLPGTIDETGEFVSHGTAVAGVIAGTPATSLADGAQGVAWGADLAVFALYTGPPPELELPPDLEIPPGVEVPPEFEFPQSEYFPPISDLLAEFDAEDAAQLRTILAWRDGERRVDFLNLSIGSQGLIDGFTETELRSVMAQTIAVIAQEDAEEKTIFVWAAGNDNGVRCLPTQPYCLKGRVVAASPSLEAGLAARIAELRDHTVAVVGVKEDGEIAENSNRCGLAAEWCIAAPGDGINLAWFGPDEDGTPGVRRTRIEGGTSFAAPMVTGGLAVMKHRFRGQLSNTDLLARLLETADRRGRYADEKVYGRGLMDLGAATEPVGAERVAMGPRVAGPGEPLGRTRLGLGGAVGDSLEQALGLREIVAFDSLGAPFWHRLGERMTHTAPSAAQSRLRALLSETADGDGIRMDPTAPGLRRTDRGGPAPAVWEAHILGTPSGTAAGHLGLAGEAFALRHTGGGALHLDAFSSIGMEGVLPVAGAALSWRQGPIGLRGGWLSERESALGTQAEGAFGRLTANGVFLGIEGERTLAAWRVFGVAEIGLTRPDAKGGLIQDLSPLATSAVAVHAERALGEDRTVRLSVSQPLRVEAGRARLSIPVGRTAAGEVVSERAASSLAPSGRQVDLSAQWHQRLDLGGELRIGAYLSLDPGHDAGTDPGLDLLAGYRLVF